MPVIGAFLGADTLLLTWPRRKPPCCSICFEELDLGRREFEGLSGDARAFIQALLVKDPLKAGRGRWASWEEGIYLGCSWPVSS